jgi:hypothetical protein
LALAHFLLPLWVGRRASSRPEANQIGRAKRKANEWNARNGGNWRTIQRGRRRGGGDEGMSIKIEKNGGGDEAENGGK